MRLQNETLDGVLQPFVVGVDAKKAADPIPLIPTRTSLYARAGAEMAREARSPLRYWGSDLWE